MRINKKKYELAKARACMGSKDIISAGIPKGTLSKVLSGEVRPETVGKIAKILHVDVTDLIEN